MFLPTRNIAAMALIVRTAGDPFAAAKGVTDAIAAIDPDQPVTNIETVDELMDKSRAQPRFTMMLLSFFSSAALALAVIGIYGVLAYSVSERRVELGIRMALGAERAWILRMVLRQGLALTIVGIVIGFLAALVLSKLMSDLVYSVGVRDFWTFVLAPLVFLGIGLLASYLPARRATKVDPVEALRGK